MVHQFFTSRTAIKFSSVNKLAVSSGLCDDSLRGWLNSYVVTSFSVIKGTVQK